MENSERLKALKELRRQKVDAGFKKSQDFTDWQGRIAPLLNFNDDYHTRFKDLVGKAFAASGLPARRPFYRQLDSIIAQAITELEQGLTPRRDIQLTDEHGIWWFFQHCTTKTRGWVISVGIFVLSSTATAAYFAGRSHFISQVIDLWKRINTP